MQTKITHNLTFFPTSQTSSSTTTKTITTPAKLYGKDIGAYDDVDVDELLAQLSPEEITMLAKEVDPDVSSFAIKGALFWRPSTVKLTKTNAFPGFLPATEPAHQLRVRERANRTAGPEEADRTHQQTGHGDAG